MYKRQLYTFGRIVEEHLGFKTYAAFYLICGIFGGVAYALLNALGLLFHTMGWPTPDAPTSATNAPAGTVNDTRASTWSRRPPSWSVYVLSLIHI